MPDWFLASCAAKRLDPNLQDAEQLHPYQLLAASLYGKRQLG
jgi:hypothetical protein